MGAEPLAQAPYLWLLSIKSVAQGGDENMPKKRPFFQIPPQKPDAFANFLPIYAHFCATSASNLRKCCESFRILHEVPAPESPLFGQ